MVAIDGYIGRCPLNHLDQPRPYTKPVFLLAGNLTGMTTHAILLKDHQ
jgi:hypothetical protein